LLDSIVATVDGVPTLKVSRSALGEGGDVIRAHLSSQVAQGSHG
jgi:hypothetical protein